MPGLGEMGWRNVWDYPCRAEKNVDCSRSCVENNIAGGLLILAQARGEYHACSSKEPVASWLVILSASRLFKNHLPKFVLYLNSRLQTLFYLLSL